MNPVSEDIKKVLEDAGLGIFADTEDWGIFINSLPDSPNCATCIYDNSGKPPEGAMDSTVKPLLRPGFIIRCRGTNYLTGYQKILTICQALNRIAAFTASRGDTSETLARYSTIFQRGEPSFLLMDEKSRFIFSCGFEAVRKEI